MPLATSKELHYHYKSLAEKAETVERAGFTDSATTASAILTDNYKGCFWDTLGFGFRPAPFGLYKTLKEAELLGDKKGSTRGTDRSYFLHSIAPIAAYGNPSTLLKITFKSLGLDPGINTRQIEDIYSGGLLPSFWYSIGGDFLQDRMLGSIDEAEYRADLIGLRAVKNTLSAKKSLLLSELLHDMSENTDLIEGQKYKTMQDYIVADKCIRPLAGHHVVNYLSKFTPIFT